MIKHIAFLAVILFQVACSAPENTNTATEKVQVIKAENDSLMVFLDSIMELKIYLPQLVDSVIFSPECLEQFNALARETGGELKVVANSRFVAKEISEIIQDHAAQGTDLMIIIDKTNSMADDIGNIRDGLGQILNSLRQYDDMRLCVSTYGDKNKDGELWYDYQNFESDFAETISFFENIQLTHGGDYPESVYDGIYEAFNEGFWRSESKRLVILLGDAPSHTDKWTTYTELDIVNLANSENIIMNFYPIVLSPYNGQLGRVKKMQNMALIESLYPNPCAGPLTLKMNQYGTFNLDIFNQSGNLIKSEVINTQTYRTDFYGQPDGLYVLRISDGDKNFDTRKVILKN